MLFVIVLPFGSALAARLHHNYWLAWAVWGGCSLVAFSALWIAYGFSSSAFMVLASWAVGFLGPELWTSCRGFVSHPRFFGWVLAAGGIIFLLYNPGIVSGIIVLGIIVLVLRTMLRPLFGGRK